MLNKIGLRIDSNPGSLLSEATTVPTVPQSLPDLLD